jgi:hypothetical protein
MMAKPLYEPLHARSASMYRSIDRMDVGAYGVEGEPDGEGGSYLGFIG